MNSSTQKIIAGCGVGCLLIVMLVVGVGWMGYRWVQSATEAFEAAEMTNRQLEEQYGETDQYDPPVEAGVVPERMEVFLLIRDGVAAEREAIAELVASMAPEDGAGGVGDGLQFARAGVGLAPRLLDFVTARNQALLDHGMGLGEYTWLYWLSYYAWLGHSPLDSELHEIMQDRSESDGGVQMHFDGGPDADDVAWQVRHDIGEMLQSLEADLAADPERAALHASVVNELNALGIDPERIPWEDGLPEEFAEGLEVFSERLEATYSRATNPFELIVLD